MLRDPAREAVLIKGGHGAGTESVDHAGRAGDVVYAALAQRASIPKNCMDRLHVVVGHRGGTRQGADLVSAARQAKVYVTEAIAAADTLKIGHGHGPVHHFYQSGKTA